MTVVYEAPPLAELITEVDSMTGVSNLYSFHNDNLKGGLHLGRKSIYKILKYILIYFWELLRKLSIRATSATDQDHTTFLWIKWIIQYLNCKFVVYTFILKISSSIIHQNGYFGQSFMGLRPWIEVYTQVDVLVDRWI